MFGIGMPELVIVLVLALLVFGGRNLPELGSGLGKAIRGFREAADEVRTGARPQVAAAYACPHCGNRQAQDAAFCAQCGKGLLKG
jgi:TatA/E family protein of Tat protein translocase